jgi:small subunit ribosomal protein S20
MPNLQNAKKALRVSDRKRVINDSRRRAMKEAVRATKTAIKSDAKVIQKELSAAYQAIDKALKRGVIKKNTAARKKSRLAQSAKKASKK